MRQYQKQRGECHSGAHHLVKLIWKEINAQQASQQDVVDRAGINLRTMTKWRDGSRSPRMLEVEAVLNVLGFNLVARRVRDDE